ncbi:hypothetical protein PHAVU_009G046700 [Phaseolus vulgaris]|uniref:Uncharacterized protein n=1 Tax=Phaseolus vulgaris TaxID=3885 RepID=V7AV23_PHAVU|nr:hypothetical protein PHAVU_009G046700g [Phaseolus vulgaris]ESW08448.1 hypothetical protein PHAVU_009G046700g [Phaseolus vulgaris]
MAFLAFSKLMSFPALLAILLLLISFDLGAAAQPDIKPGRKLFQCGGGSPLPVRLTRPSVRP